MRGDSQSVPLDFLGVLRVRGADSVAFLQGQLSNDVRLVGSDRALLAGYHNPQGRAVALLRLLQLAGDDLLAILPRELVAPVMQRLGKFILRSKVKLADESGHWSISGLIGQANWDDGVGPTQLPDTVNGVTRRDGALAVCIARQPARWLLLSPASGPGAEAAERAAALECGVLWERLAIAAGEPEVYAATSEAFVAQMLNLDALGAIAFDKGCYTGQEIIARAHYRGRVKRRMQRFLTDARAQLTPGDNGTLADGRAFRVVRAVRHDDGRCEFLAVVGSASGPGTGTGTAGPDDATPSESSPKLSAMSLELPYSVPD
jgi:tRNA-modifying protein YgfZ